LQARASPSGLLLVDVDQRPHVGPAEQPLGLKSGQVDAAVAHRMAKVAVPGDAIVGAEFDSDAEPARGRRRGGQAVAWLGTRCWRGDAKSYSVDHSSLPHCGQKLGCHQ
jgi:hypothetical protein